VIPQDWNVMPLGDLGKFRKGRGVRRDEASSGDLPCVRYGELYTHHNDIVRRFNSYISQSVASTSTPISPGDILFAASGETKEEIGKSVAFLGPEPAYAGGDIIILSLRSGDPAFLGYALNASYVVRQKAAKGQGDAVVHITTSGLTNITVALPVSVAEQEAIAEALSDTNALIESLQQLIAKKRALKQGAMQALLTGRQRLPGFQGGWRTAQLCELGSCLRGVSYNPSSDLADGDLVGFVRLLRANNVQAERIDLEGLQFVVRTRVEDSQILQFGDLLICMANGSKDLVGKAAVFRIDDGSDYTFGAFMGCFRPDSDRGDPMFCAYLFQGEAYRAQLVVILAGSSINNLNPSQLERLEFRIPVDTVEQAAIATVLSDMDAEIDVLGARLAKVHDLKTGMMQALLTGRIRLPPDKVA
jgi:type I restriction enzyme S subunit